MRPVVECPAVEEPGRGTQRPLALAMLACGALGYLAWAYLRYGNRRPFGDPVVPGLIWLSVISIACWAVLLVRPGRRRILVGVVSSGQGLRTGLLVPLAALALMLVVTVSGAVKEVKGPRTT